MQDKYNTRGQLAARREQEKWVGGASPGRWDSKNGVYTIRALYGRIDRAPEHDGREADQSSRDQDETTGDRGEQEAQITGEVVSVRGTRTETSAVLRREEQAWVREQRLLAEGEGGGHPWCELQRRGDD